jgi:hypothetical protein
MPTDAHARRPLQLRLAIDAGLLDLGLAGLAIETETRLSTETTVEIELDSVGARAPLRGRVVWCFFHGTSAAATGEQVPVYRAGIEFSDVLTPLASDLVRLLESGLALQGDSRLFGRFRVHQPTRVVVRWGGEATLLEVSGGSVRVEVAFAVEAAPGTAAELRLADGGEPIRAAVLDVTRGEAPGVWRLELALDGGDGPTLARLRAASS